MGFPKARFTVTCNDRRSREDIKSIMLLTDEIRSLGFKSEHKSRKAVEKAVEELMN